MVTEIPDLDFARIEASCTACKDVGGDFFDVVRSRDAVAVVLADASGKGLPAALLAAVLQGVICPQLQDGVPIRQVVASANRFFCQKKLDAKYATMVIAKLERSGRVEYISCGHVPPLLVTSERVQRLINPNFPVGLMPGAEFQSDYFQMLPGDRLVLVTDGVTEACNRDNEMFGDERLEQMVRNRPCLQDLIAEVFRFCVDSQLSDDCTAVQLTLR